MHEANPIALAEELSRVLQRYISTALPISRRYPRLADRFRQLLAEQCLVEGPYVEALPDFEKGASIDELLKRNGGYLHDALGQLPTAGRKLHRHQERALASAVRQGRSLLVATGTGSGKTETFLYPIAHHLLNEREPDNPGVRALLVYPMNALANDQLYYRIAPLFGRDLLAHNITFGRYTGQIRAGTRREAEEARLLNNAKLMKELGYPSQVPANWLLTREEMLLNPPKVLITNYAMLEHLLLLPRNASLFATNALRFIVLDEIHTYRGAQATEVAFLLRKLKNRLNLDRPLQVFGTSASLAKGEHAKEGLKRFASQLFGETVDEVVRGERVVHDRLKGSDDAAFSLDVSQWVELGAVLEEFTALTAEDQSAEAWNGLLASRAALPGHLHANGGGPVGPFLEQRFSASREIRKVAALLDAGGVRHFRDLALSVFDARGTSTTDEERYRALSAVIRMGMVARASEGAFPLLPGRYHIAVNSIEGLAVLPSTDNEGWSDVKAARHAQSEQGVYFPLLTCRKCGQPFLEGWSQGERLHTHRPDVHNGRTRRMVFWLGKPAVGTEDEEDEAETPGAPAAERHFIDVKTGDLGQSAEAVELHAVVTEEDEDEKAHYVKKCPACGGRSVGAEAEVVTRMHPGDDALGAVVTQRVVEALPPAVIDHADPRPAHGRNVLTFSDNRQDAAFFAPYFEGTAANIALRSAIRYALKGRTSALNAPQLADQAFDFWQSDGRQPLLLDSAGEIKTDRQDVGRLLRGAIGYEFCTPSGRRNSLESLGVVAVTYDEAKLRPLRQQLAQALPETLPRDEQSVDAIVHFLLDTVRRDRALSRFHDISMDDESVWSADYKGHRSFDIEGGDNAVKFRWLPSQDQKRHNRRTWYLVEQLGLTRDAAMAFLRKAWDVLVRPPVAMLVRHQPGFALNGDHIRFADGDGRSLYACKSCGMTQQHVVLNKCSAFRCRGEVALLADEERSRLRQHNHYLASYDEPWHVTMRAREHTAALSTELREAIEQDFAERRLNLLSCTTTMEMGVDLGDLEAVINLNVPPGIANYQQRTGRAGRRAQAAPICVTVAKNSNYDQAVFRGFRDYLQSSPGVPFISLSNPTLFQRHQQSVLLSHYLRGAVAAQDINAPSLKHLFGEVFDQAGKQRFLDGLFAWVDGESGAAAIAEAERLADLLPGDYAAVASRGPYLRNAFVGGLREFAEEAHDRYATYTTRIEAFAAAEEYGNAAHWKRQGQEYMDQFLVTQLSRRGLIPTYSFPVHSLTLEVMTGQRQQRFQGESDIALSRDASMGISEYAPGAEVVADGRIWESAGLAQYPKVFMPDRWYVACPDCFHVDVADTAEELSDECGNCGSRKDRRQRKFVEPHGFVTSADKNRGRDPSVSRRRVKPADEARLIAAPRSDQFEDTELPFLQTALLSARAGAASGMRGTLFIANRGVYGEGYWRCWRCNYCRPVKPTGPAKAGRKTAKKFVHTDPLSGQRCANEELPKRGLDFAHQFDTDVRLLRFLSPLPVGGDADGNQRRFHERLARTLAEALRIAASELLELHPGELRAVYRLYPDLGNTLEVVLYDGVPGGAGYSERLGQPGYSLRQLLDGARARLDCPARCDSGCRTCLCDYGNQRHWDSFERLPALQWLQGLLDPHDTALGPGSYVRWTSPSLGGLDDRFSAYDEVSLVAKSLVENELDEPSLDQLLTWLRAGKRLNLYLLNPPDERPKQYAQLAAYRHLYPYVVDGRLSVFGLKDAPVDQLSRVPRCFAGPADGAPMVRQSFPLRPLLAPLLSAPADLGAQDAATRAEIESMRHLAEQCEAALFRDGEQMVMWEYGPGQRRNLDEIFAAVNDSHVKQLTIRDPFCGNSRNRRRLKSLLAYLIGRASTIERLDVYCKEAKERDGSVEFKHDIAREVETIAAQAGIPNAEAYVKGSNEQARTFHDREIALVTVDSAGCDAEHRYFLTGGIDYLFDEKTETKVFYLRPSKRSEPSA